MSLLSSGSVGISGAAWLAVIKDMSWNAHVNVRAVAVGAGCGVHVRTSVSFASNLGVGYQ